MHDGESTRVTGLAVGVMLLAALARVVVSIDPMPVWSMDPFTMWIPKTSLGPTALFALDMFGLVAAAVVIWSIRARVTIAPAALLTIGVAGIAFHAARSPSHAEIGVPWISAIAGAFAVAHLPRTSMWRSVALASILAVAVLLVGRSAVQVFIEHPQTIAAYEQTREAFLQSQGWATDSSMARNYERRLYQAEASGWFGLSNVFGSVMMAMALAFGVLSWRALRARIDDRRITLVLTLACALCLAGLWLSMSKGAAGAGIVASAALVACLLLPKQTRLIVGLVPAMVLSGVVARGLIGERIGELSILFRWFYIDGATQIFLDHPRVGVGPAGFKDAYLIAKPPISPEEVTSAHNLLFDWLATLGVSAIALIGLLGLGCRQIGRNLKSADDHPEPSWPMRPAVFAAGTIMALLVGFSAYIERTLLTPDMGIVRALGLLGGLAIAASTVQLARTQPRATVLAVCAAALGLLAHMQIEVTGVWAGAAPMCFLLIGLACKPVQIKPESARAIAGSVCSVALLVITAILIATSGKALWRWEQAMDEATAAVQPWAEAFNQLNQSPPDSLEFRDAVQAFATLSGWPTARSNEDLTRQIDRTRSDANEAAIEHLRRAVQHRPQHAETREAAIQALLRTLKTDPTGRPSAALDEAVQIARGGVEFVPDRSRSWRLLSNTLQVTADAGDAFDAPEFMAEAYDALLHAAELDPYGLGLTLDLVDLADKLGLLDDQQAWATKALEINANLRLDPLRGLTDAERDRLEQIASDD